MENSLPRRKNADVSRTPNGTVDNEGNAAVKASGINLADIVAISCAAMMSWGWTMTLIFGGCCSNVFTLETIVKEEPESGLLITLVQFTVTALFTLHGHVSWKYPFVKPLAIPFSRWIPQILLYFSVSMMNNFVFGYKISVPVHIILRSGGSVTTMVVGWIWGKKYSRGQIVGVMMLTVGVVIAAMADAQAKGKTSKSAPSNLTGLVILFFAQLLSACMGIYTEQTYIKHGAHPHENLFISHMLSLPLFLPFAPGLFTQFQRLWSSEKMDIRLPASLFTEGVLAPFKGFSLRLPSHIVALAGNALTQYACIRGVNLLGGRTSALGVTIVLNVRKLVSLFLSIWIFGNELPLGVLLGAAVVFTGASVYGGAAPRKKPKSIGNGTEKANGEVNGSAKLKTR